MKAKNAKVSYDIHADVLSIENTARAGIDYAREMGNVIVHFSKKEQPVLIEILQASKLLKHQPKSVRENLRRALVAV